MEKIPYIRVGTTYYKKAFAPSIIGDFYEVILPWKIETIKQDEDSKDYVSRIPKYDGFTCIPSHLDYKQTIGSFYNTYHPLSHKPTHGNIEYSYKFSQHIFGNQIELGLDYLQLLYMKPTQILPILCLVSKERATGKSTFLKWLKLIFENNMTYLTNDSFSSQFNSDWADRLLICIDEVLFNKEELTERIKYLSTTNINKMEAKGKDKREVEFFGKFVLCSNNETGFIKIDAVETRFWVRKILPIEAENINMLERLKKEIPAFLHFLINRKLYTQKPITRMWFSPEHIRTKALDRLKNFNRPQIEQEIITLFNDIFEEKEIETLNFQIKDVVTSLSMKRIIANTSEVRYIIKEDWKILNRDNTSTYCTYVLSYANNFVEQKGKGRYYTLKKDFLLEKIDDLMTD